VAKILIIDDDEALLGSLAHMLAEAGHTVGTATDGLKGEKLFRAQPFDVIITDIVMPNREGLETIGRLHREFPKVGIIAISGIAQRAKTYLDMAQRLGARHQLEKPFTPDQLLAAIAETLTAQGQR
jgi:DNA-binding response OmpR family regulator